MDSGSGTGPAAADDGDDDAEADLGRREWLAAVSLSLDRRTTRPVAIGCGWWWRRRGGGGAALADFRRCCRGCGCRCSGGGCCCGWPASPGRDGPWRCDCLDSPLSSLPAAADVGWSQIMRLPEPPRELARLAEDEEDDTGGTCMACRGWLITTRASSHLRGAAAPLAQQQASAADRSDATNEILAQRRGVQASKGALPSVLLRRPKTNTT